MRRVLIASIVFVGLLGGLIFSNAPVSKAEVPRFFDESSYTNGQTKSFTLELVAGEPVTIEAICVPDGGGADPRFFLYDDAMNLLVTNDDGGPIACGGYRSSYASFVAPYTGIYYLDVNEYPFLSSPGGVIRTIVTSFPQALDDGRLCDWPDYAVYTYDDSIDVYGIWDSEGYFVLRVTQEELDAAPGAEGVNTLIASSADGNVQVYRLETSNVYQVHAGLNFVRFIGLPGSEVFCSAVELP